MGFLNSAVHAVGNVVGPALVGAGTAYDYLTPGTGTSKATNTGKAITNPNVTYSNPFASLPGGSGSGFSYGPAPGGGSQPGGQAGGGQVFSANTNVPSGGGQPGAVAADPYARYGGVDGYNKLASGFDTQKQNVYGTSREAAQNAAISRQSGILDFIESMKSGQRAVDERGVQNELGKRQGTSSILDMVSRGIHQGGVMLAGKNASDSSAADQIGRAYGDIGHRELSTLGNQYELENRNIGMAQEDLNTQRGTGLRKFDENKMQTVNNIVLQARDRLAQLDAAMVEADMPGRVQIEQEKEAIKQEALGILGQFDQQLSQGVQGVNPASVDDRRRTAAGLATAGVAAQNPFEFNTEAPAQFAGTGPFASELPLFSLNRRREA